MAGKAFLVLCAQALVIQATFSQCMNPAGVDYTRYTSPYGLAGRGYGYDGSAYDALAAPFGVGGRLGYDGLPFGCGNALDITPTSGGSLTVTSASAIPPVGISVTSENEYGGILCVAGELPFVGTVEVEGEVPTAGAGAVNYGCGDGVTAMESVADILTPGIAAPIGAIAAPGLGLRSGYTGLGCGCGY